jgi:hypothetical protein
VDNVTRYREIVRRLVEEYASHKPSYGEVDSYPMIDTEHDHYIAMQTGWVDDHRVHGAFVHLDIIDGKVWIQFDGTDRPVADELEATGVPKEDIVLGEKPADVRPLTGYGVG